MKGEDRGMQQGAETAAAELRGRGDEGRCLRPAFP